MREVSLLVKHTDRDRVIELLADAKAVHLVDHKKFSIGKTDIDIGTPTETAAALSDALTKTRTLLNKLPKRESPEQPVEMSFQERLATVQHLAEQYATYEQKLSSLNEQEELLKKQLGILEKLESFTSPIETIFRTKAVENLLLDGSSNSKHALLQQLNPVYTLKNGHALFISIPTGKRNDDLIKEAGFTVVDLTPLRDLTGTIDDIKNHLREPLEHNSHSKKNELTNIENLSVHIPFLRDSDHVIGLELMKAQAPLRFGSTKRVTLINGFVPEGKWESFKQNMQEIDAVMTAQDAEEGPIALKNPPVLNNFEELIKMYTLPKYNEIDPTSLMAITFPIFFGFMLGDIGYGIALLILFTILRIKIPNLKHFFDIIILSAISTIAFGIFFGEFFGTEQFFGYHFHPLFHRASDLNIMFGLCALLGLAHINLGLTLGIINETKKHGFAHAIIEKGSWMLLQVGILLVAANYGLLESIPVLNSISLLPFVGWSVLAASVAGIYWGEGLQGMFELPMIVSHTLSYFRLLAIGLASVYLAVVVNDLGGGMVANGGIGIVMGILVIILGHTVNLALGLLGPFLHSLRLHYAEFFMKFYGGGGKAYQPFGVIEQQ